MLWGSKPVISKDAEKIHALLTRGVEEVLPTSDSLRALLTSGKQLRVKLGFDPTGERIHVGHSAPLLKLKEFQDLGHTVVFIVGDFTAVIGDTSDKDSERPMLVADAIEKNMATWKAQVSKILDLSKTEFRYNSEWLGKLTYREIGEHADQFSVADFISRENIKRRLDAGKRVSLREVLYPLMQGYDSVAIDADVEIGGSDQRFNLLAGRTLQSAFGKKPQEVLTLSLLTDASGKKMSKTGGATVFITDPPNDMFGKAMTVPDELVRAYFISMTRIPLVTVESLLAGHPKEAKMALAGELVRMYHGEAAAEAARANFENTFSKGGVPDDIQTVEAGSGFTVDQILLDHGLVKSKSEITRLRTAGAIKETTEDITPKTPMPMSSYSRATIVRVGKHRFIRILHD